jgi:general stress protein YciG
MATRPHDRIDTPAETARTESNDAPAVTNDAESRRPRALRGFAAMSAERQRSIASMGGRAAHARGTAHAFTPEEARRAGAKGGRVAHARGTAHEFTSEEARAAGRKGGVSSARARARARAATSTAHE